MRTIEYDGEILRFERGEYQNGNLAIRLWTQDDEPFSTLTVNLGGVLPRGYAYLDVNNNPSDLIRKIIDEQPLAISLTGAQGQSGYCAYPLAYVDFGDD